MDAVARSADLLFLIGIRGTTETEIRLYYNLVQVKRSKLSNKLYRKNLIKTLTVVEVIPAPNFYKSGWVFKKGDTTYWVLNRLHREERGPDGLVLPAIIEESGRLCWFWHNMPHRLDRGTAGEILPAEFAPSKHSIVWVYGGEPDTKKPKKIIGVD